MHYNVYTEIQYKFSVIILRNISKNDHFQLKLTDIWPCLGKKVISGKKLYSEYIV